MRTFTLRGLRWLGSDGGKLPGGDRRGRPLAQIVETCWGYAGATVTMTPRWSLAVAVVASKSLARRSGESQR
jgi:hypothetical protein